VASRVLALLAASFVVGLVLASSSDDARRTTGALEGYVGDGQGLPMPGVLVLFNWAADTGFETADVRRTDRYPVNVNPQRPRAMQASVPMVF
jgi:hypothetical protein